MCACVRVCACVCVCVYMCVCVCMCEFVSVYMYMCVCAARVCGHECVCMRGSKINTTTDLRQFVHSALHVSRQETAGGGAVAETEPKHTEFSNK